MPHVPADTPIATHPLPPAVDTQSPTQTAGIERDLAKSSRSLRVQLKYPFPQGTSPGP